MTNTPQSQSKRKTVGGDLVIPVAAVAFTAYYFISIIDAPWTAQVSAVFIGSVLTVLVGVFVVRTFNSVRAGEARWGIGNLPMPMALIPKRLALLALTIAYIVALPWGGFTLTTFAFLYAAMLLLGGAKVRRKALWASLAFCLSGYLLFVVAFQTRFPQGPFEQLIKALL